MLYLLLLPLVPVREHELLSRMRAGRLTGGGEEPGAGAGGAGGPEVGAVLRGVSVQADACEGLKQPLLAAAGAVAGATQRRSGGGNLVL